MNALWAMDVFASIAHLFSLPVVRHRGGVVAVL